MAAMFTSPNRHSIRAACWLDGGLMCSSSIMNGTVKYLRKHSSHHKATEGHREVPAQVR